MQSAYGKAVDTWEKNGAYESIRGDGGEDSRIFDGVEIHQSQKV